MRESSCHYAPFRGRHLCAVLVTFLLGVSVAHCGVIFGVPPSFTSPSEPGDQFVFEVDADGNKVSLTFLCPVTGDPAPNVTWYRSGEVDKEFTTADGSYVFPNITQANMTYASGAGVKYYCTATNSFGTIRSPNVTAFYAFFAGFEQAQEVTTDVDVIVGERVALKCDINPGSNPTPAIEWVMNDGSEDTVVVEETDSNTINFVDDNEYVILQVTNDVIDNQYFCRVTNKDGFQTERAPTTYTFTAVTSFPDPPNDNGVMLYKGLENKTAPRVAFDAMNPPTVLFGVAAAYENGLPPIWLVNDNNGDSRLDSRGSVAAVEPRFLTADDTNTVINVEARIIPLAVGAVVAYLHLLDPATIPDPPPDKRDVLTGVEQTFTCAVAGSPLPKLSWYFNGELLEGDDERMIDEYTLTIPSPTVEHSGMYQCFAANDNGAAFVSWTMQVREPTIPMVSVSFADNVEECLEYSLIQQDEPPVDLFVNLTADPCPEITWYLNDTVLTDLPYYNPNDTVISDGCEGYTLGDTEFSFQLTVEVFNENTTGFYSASVTNPGGTAEVDGTFVTGRVRALITDLRSEPDSPIPDTNTGCLLAGDDVEIVCDHVSYPVGTVMFFKDGDDVDLSSDRVNQTCERLLIYGVDESDSGSYTCRVQNDPDPQVEDTSRPLVLTYCIIPEIVGDLTFSKNNPEEDEETIATCQWTGDPEPDITWYKDGEALNEAELPGHIRITQREEGGVQLSELQILSVEIGDAGDYTCNVSNPVGFDHQVKRLEVRDKDEPVLSEIAIIGISAGGAGFIVLMAVVIVLLCCVYHCAKRGHGGEYVVPGSNKNNVPMSNMGGPMTYNVDAPDGPDEEPEAFNPDYASLPAMRPAQPPQYKPTPHYPMEMVPEQEEFEKLPPSDDDFVGPYGQDNGGMHPGYQQPTVDDFVSDDAQFV